MTEEIIIDGVNVAGCEFYTPTCVSMHIWGETTKTNKCEENHNCYYKQLKHLEQARDKLKKKLGRKEVQLANAEFDLHFEEMKTRELKQENQRLFNKSIGLCAKNIEYKSALEKIREMILYCEDEYNCDRCKYHDNCLVDDDKFPDFSKALVNKINEVLKNENRES